MENNKPKKKTRDGIFIDKPGRRMLLNNLECVTFC